MIAYNSPERQQLVDNIVAAINRRNIASMNMPWSCFSYWRACAKVEAADVALIRHDRKQLSDDIAYSRKLYWALPLESRENSPEEHAYYDAIESWQEHVDAHGEVI